MQTYIFSGALIPSLGAIERAVAPAGLRIAHSDDIGLDYATTLRLWRERFIAELPAVTALGFDEPFVRTWLMYLAFSEAAFTERTLANHQLLLTQGAGAALTTLDARADGQADRHAGGDPAAHPELAGHRDLTRCDRRHQIIVNPIGDGLVKRALIAEAPQIELQALELDA